MGIVSTSQPNTWHNKYWIIHTNTIETLTYFLMIWFLGFCFGITFRHVISTLRGLWSVWLLSPTGQVLVAERLVMVPPSTICVHFLPFSAGSYSLQVIFFKSFLWGEENKTAPGEIITRKWTSSVHEQGKYRSRAEPWPSEQPVQQPGACYSRCRGCFWFQQAGLMEVRTPGLSTALLHFWSTQLPCQEKGTEGRMVAGKDRLGIEGGKEVQGER